MNSSIQILDINNSFSWVNKSLQDRVPKLLEKYGFDVQNTHIYKVVALHSIENVAQVVGYVDFPKELVMKTTYTAIEKTYDINHKFGLNPNYHHLVLDAEYESDRQEYLIADDDPEIYRLVKDEYITAASIHGQPRFYLEKCDHCDSGNCECRLVPEGLVLGVGDGIALALVMTKTGKYYDKIIPGEPPADRMTSIDIMLTDHSINLQDQEQECIKHFIDDGRDPDQAVAICKNDPTAHLTAKLTVEQLVNTPREKLHTLFTSNKQPNPKTSMSGNPPTNTPPANPPATPPAGNDDIKIAITALTQKIDAFGTEFKTVKDQVTQLTDDLKKSNDLNKTSFDNLTQTTKDLGTKMTDIEKTAKSVALTGKGGNQPPLSPSEISVAKEELVRTTPLVEFIPAKAK